MASEELTELLAIEWSEKELAFGSPVSLPRGLLSDRLPHDSGKA